MKNRCKIFQRAAALLCCMLFLPSLVAVPAHAASDESGFFNVLEFGTANGSGSNVVTDTLPYDVVYETTKDPYFYVEMIVATAHLVNISYGGKLLTRRMINYADGTYRWRFFGELVGDPSGYLTFHVSDSTNVGGTCTVIFEQLYVSSLQATYAQSYGGMKVFNSDSPNNYTYMDGPGSPLTLYLDQQSNLDHYAHYNGYATFPEWRHYDYLDVYLDFYVSSIDGFGAFFGDGNSTNVYLPHTVTFIDSNFSDTNSFNPDISIPYSARRLILVRIDLTGLDRDSAFEPYLFFNGQYDPYYGDNFISLMSVTGSFDVYKPSSLAVFWQRLQGLLVAIFGSSASNESQLNQFEEEIGSIEDSMESVPDPDVGTVDFDGTLSESSADFSSFGEFFVAIYNVPFIHYGILLSMLMALGAYVLYGKR